jgi:hypothetical protein
VSLLSTSQSIQPEESSDDLSALRRQHTQRVSTPASQRGSQMGSLSQDIRSMPRTLLGDELAGAGDASAAAMMPAELASEDVVLVEDDLNRNECMRALVKALFVIQEKFERSAIEGKAPDADGEVATGQMAPWMQFLLNVLNASAKSQALHNVQLFVAKLIVNYHKNLARRRAAGAAVTDMFRPFADKFFDAFFHSDTGLANRLSTRWRDHISEQDKKELLHFEKLQDCFTYLLKDICGLWESWIALEVSCAHLLFRRVSLFFADICVDIFELDCSVCTQ